MTSGSFPSQDPLFTLRSLAGCQGTHAGAEGRQEVYRRRLCPRTVETTVASALGPHPHPLTNAGDAVLSQHRPVVTEADDLAALRVYVALVYLTVAAV